ncbi:MAG: hypothetical protein WC201_02915 [Bacilli bacterium]
MYFADYYNDSNSSYVFLNHYLLDKKSILNKVFITKAEKCPVPRYKQTAIMFVILNFIILLMLVMSIIGLINGQRSMIEFVFYFNFSCFFLDISIPVLFIFIMHIQVKQCDKKQKTLSTSEIAKIIKEIQDKHPGFFGKGIS